MINISDNHKIIFLYENSVISQNEILKVGDFVKCKDMDEYGNIKIVQGKIKDIDESKGAYFVQLESDKNIEQFYFEDVTKI